ncbi:MAG: bifunctional adenosylcobinamide kinase/adenosylcobinamide-phosphate guanylyltransferase [Thermodesulfobacteriota bacterium]|nr:bifunctional adenosylcobinamide kinase/adenosylcobinamide-phosphate guanylyltransferase [Thermodesulfobacteriota bacterium]
MNKTNKTEKIFVLGGCRSGKSRFAEQWAASRFQRKCFIATLDVKNDAEMAKRIAMHKASRGDGWSVIEEPLLLADALLNSPGKSPENSDVILIDCLTMWLTNLILTGRDDEAIEKEVDKLTSAVRACSIPLVLVANEVGLGIVPESSLGRRFRDLAGWTNQQVAKACETVYFVAAGLPMVLK